MRRSWLHLPLHRLTPVSRHPRHLAVVCLPSSVPAERPRIAVAPRPELVGDRVHERTYREEEVAAILRRAAQLERDRGTMEGALNLREIESIARDSGIDLTLVRQAARELDEDQGSGIGAAIAGAPLRRSIERVVDGEIGAEHHERLAEEIREVLSSSAVGSRWLVPGGIASLGRSLTVSGFTGTSSLEVTVAPREGKTLIRIAADRSQLAGGLYGGIVGGVGGGFGANVGWMVPALLDLPWVAGLAGAALVVLGAYGLARGIFVTHARGLDRRLDALADRLELIARQDADRPSLPSTAV